ncbi:hypothetical protein BDY17DRAFT_293597 [Neohortaea acidophila]|uniref:Uncharacterized protein n=1 Tax=Neohortaea acidophila TaxID=245834 RepID=A0A6A6Q180_9PEZI|nr:uncharacterized protein BDY17DRAFT_293597 [Neohortaea acidophila]KAF2485433.1 hypothetical protein BDY17DRAFT_293597 [Neohortaea acidophila]
MHPVSPRPSLPAHLSFQQPSSADHATRRPSLMKRQSSQSSHNSRHAQLSPSSTGEWESQPARHHVKPARKTKIVLPRAHGSARNLAKLAQQAPLHTPTTEEPRRLSRPRLPKDSDSEIRLPRSLEDQRIPPLRRNLTAHQLPRNLSHTKLKKNLSHGQLTKLALNSTANRRPSSPVGKIRNKRPKSADMAGLEKDLHQQEVELAQHHQDHRQAFKKVDFAVGSSDGGSDAEDLPQMEGQGLQEDEWTDQSTSASPYSTRQNTANNSRRASVVAERPLDRKATSNAAKSHDYISHQAQQSKRRQAPPEVDGTPAQGYDNADEAVVEDDVPSPQSTPLPREGDMKDGAAQKIEPAEAALITRQPQISFSGGTKEPRNPAERHLLARSNNNPAPALVSNISALNARRDQGSPAQSMASAPSRTAGDEPLDPEQEELVSRFVPSGSHPSGGSGANTTSTTPKTGSIHTPDSDNMPVERHKDRGSPSFGIGPVTPDSAPSLSSSAQTPGFWRSRNEERMMNEKAIAEMEDAGKMAPIIPAHVFDRRNESLKSYLNLAALGGDSRGGLSTPTGLSMGPEIFQGRFKAVNTELKVVQRFRDPVGESVARLFLCKERDMGKLRTSKASPAKQQATKLRVSKSSTTLPRQASRLATSTSPPESPSPHKPAMTSAKSATSLKRSDSRPSKVTFSQASPTMRDMGDEAEGQDADAIARQLWEKMTA